MITVDIIDLYNSNAELSVLDAIQEYAHKFNVDVEEILDAIEDDTIFKEILHKDLIERKYVKDGEPDFLSLWIKEL